MSIVISPTTGLTGLPVPLSVAEGGTGLTTGGFGVGQTWQNVAGSRAIGTTYTNATGKPIAISISARTSAGADFWLFVNGTEIAITTLTAATIDGVHSTIVPSGSTYKVTLAGSTTIRFWWELR